MLRQALPAFQYVRRDVNILAQFLYRMPAQEEAVKEGRLVLGFGELLIRHCHLLKQSKRQF